MTWHIKVTMAMSKSFHQKNISVYADAAGKSADLLLDEGASASPDTTHHVAMARYFAPERNWNPTSSIEMQNVDAA